jgi:hypothetical protein
MGSHAEGSKPGVSSKFHYVEYSVVQIATDILEVSKKAIESTVTSEVEETLLHSNTPIESTVLIVE